MLAGGQACTLAIQFVPIGPGPVTGTAMVGGNPVSLSGTGVGPYVVTPSALDFGQVQVGMGNAQYLTITNPGEGTEPVPAVTFSGFEGTAFTTLITESTTCNGLEGNMLAGGQACMLAIQFVPIGPGSVTGTAMVGGNPVSLSGTGVGPN